MGWQQQIDNNISEPAELHGLPNGQLPDSVLTVVTDRYGNFAGKLCHTAARAWRAMIAAAGADDVTVSARDPGTSPSSTYRPLVEQRQLWNDNYDHTDHGHGGRSCGGDYRFLKDGMNVVACPGTSNHGRGLAIDSNVEVDGVLPWLEAHARTFGFQWEIASESWHIHYCPGDAIPQAVLDFEGPPPVHQEDDDMVNQLLQPDFGPEKGMVFLVSAVSYAYVGDPKAYDQLVAQWGVHRPVNYVAWENFKAGVDRFVAKVATAAKSQ